MWDKEKKFAFWAKKFEEADFWGTTSTISSNTRICATLRVALSLQRTTAPMPSMTTWSSTTSSTASRSSRSAWPGQEPYCGEWDSEEDFARHIVDECYNLESEMGDLARYFDYEAFGRDLFMYDYTMGANNNVFRVI